MVCEKIWSRYSSEWPYFFFYKRGGSIHILGLLRHFLWVRVRTLVMDEMGDEIWNSTWASCMQINNNYSMSPSWIWSDKITNERVTRVGYNHFISNKGEWNNCFSKYSNRVLPLIFISTKRPERAYNFWSHAPRLPPSPDYYITKSWMKVTASTQTTICRQLVAKTKLELFNRSNTR